jgi:WD40 repeat protein
VCFAADGHTIATAMANSVVCLWDAATLEPRGVLRKAVGRVNDVRFSPDGETVAGCCDDGSVQLWDRGTRQRRAWFKPHERRIYALDISPDGRLVATAAEDRSARLNDLASGTRVGEPLKHGSRVFRATFSPDGSLLATACEDRTLRVFDVSDPWAKTLPFRHHALRRGALDVAFGDSSHVAVMTQGVAGAAGLCMVDMTPREPQIEWEVGSLFPGRTAPGLRLVGSRSSAAAGGAPVLLAASPAPEVRAFSAVGRGAPLGKIDTGGMVNHDVAVTPDGRFAAAATFTSDVKLYEVEHDRLGAFVGIKKAMDLKGHKGKVLAIAFAPDSKRAVTASADGARRVCCSCHLGLPRVGGVLCLLSFPDRLEILFPGHFRPLWRVAGTLIIWNIDVRYKQQEDPKKLTTAGLPLPRGQCYSRLAWGPGGHIAAVHGGTVHLLDARSGEQVDAVRDAHSGAITDAVWAPVKLMGPQGKAAVLATAGQDGRARLWRGPWAAV